MPATWLDIVMIVVAAASAVFGLVRGFVREVVGILALLAGFILAAHYYSNLSTILSGVIGSRPTRDFLSFGLIFIFLVAAGSLIGRYISRHVAGMSRIFNHLLGGAIGFLKGVFFCGALVLGLTVFLSDADVLVKSRLAAPALGVTRGLIQVAPRELKQEFMDSYRRVIEIKKGGG